MDETIYDEFHIYRELELSDLLLQLTLFLGSSKAKVILSSATPSFEFISVLRDTVPTCKIKIIEERGTEKGTMVRYDTKTYLTNEKFRAQVITIIKSCIEKKLKTLAICNSNKFARELYNSLVSEGYDEFITKDTGDETRGTIKADLTRLVIISTSKSEIGINYPLDAIIMDVAPDLQSFIQRFGRISRQKEGTSFIFVKTVFNLGQQISYLKFIEMIRDYFLERRLSERTLRFLLEFRANLILDSYKKHFDFLTRIFSAINWKKYHVFLKELDDAKKKMLNYGIVSNRELDSLMGFFEDYKAGLSFLRGQSVSAKIRYQRGEDWTFTSYNLLHSLNNYEVAINSDYIELLAPSESNMVYSLIYNEVPYDFYKFTEQLKQELFEKWRRIENLGLVNKNYRWQLQELLSIDLKRVIIPEIVMLKDGTKVTLANYS
jgi:CRISPR-associated endonuclease/helicase Cas3